MLQEHSFFSYGLTYFGESQNCSDDEDLDLIELPTIFFGVDRVTCKQMQTGLFLHWFNVNE